MHSRYSATRLWSALTLAAVAFIVSLAGACADALSANERDGRFYGEAVQLGNGTARTYVELKAGAPVELGIALSEPALDNLPAGHGNGHADMQMYLLELPSQASRTPYRFVELDWNPGGHEPPGIYDLPHFDFHFYTVADSVRTSIDPTDPRFEARAARYPDAAFVPAGYVSPAPVAIPQMGVHWVDPQSPELNGETFTTTFLYGSWDGELIFAEPMITRAFILSKPDFSAEIAQPQSWTTSGYHATGYSIRWDAATKEYRIALTNLVDRRPTP